MYYAAPSGSEPSLFFGGYLLSLRSVKTLYDDFQHDFARMTDAADGSCTAVSCPF